jgi:IS30 family transposase
MRSYEHFTQSERVCLQVLRQEGRSMTEIGRELGKNKPGISRELKRNGNRDGSYNPWRGASLYLYRRKALVSPPDLRMRNCPPMSASGLEMSTGGHRRL